MASPERAQWHKAALLHAYKDRHGRLPSIMGRDCKWVPGDKMLFKVKGPVGDLCWDGWHPMDSLPADLIPKGPVVLRVRAE